MTLRDTRALMAALSGPLEITRRPFKPVATKMGMSERDLIAHLRALKESGLIRRMGAVLDHRRVGLAANALVAWKVNARDLDGAGKTLSGFRGVSHCYARRSCRSWPYNLYTMVHAANRRQCVGMVGRMAEEIGPSRHEILFTIRELKKARIDLARIMT